jgi:hypothetical protein
VVEGLLVGGGLPAAAAAVHRILLLLPAAASLLASWQHTGSWPQTRLLSMCAPPLPWLLPWLLPALYFSALQWEELLERYPRAVYAGRLM